MVLKHKLLWIVLIIMLFHLRFPPWIGAEPLVPCYFIFGDSLVDNGNNNFLSSSAKANYWPYGIDFPAGQTGRFCNGRTTVDIIGLLLHPTHKYLRQIRGLRLIGQLLGFHEFIPPYATASGEQILKGVNYASAAAGIRDESGRNLGERIAFSQQINNFKTTVSQVIEMLGSPYIAADHLGRCIYSIGMGSNDYINNYFKSSYSTNTRYTPIQYAYVLTQQYSQQLQTLYNYGAKKFAISGIGPIGSQPGQLAQYSLDGKTSIEIFNGAVQLFNYRLQKMVEDLNNNFADANFIYINAYDIVQDIITTSAAYGFKVIHSACCGEGRNNAERSCPHNHVPCQNRSDHLFWDGYHPSEAANIIISKRAFRAQKPSDSYPFDIHRLALL